MIKYTVKFDKDSVHCTTEVVSGTPYPMRKEDVSYVMVTDANEPSVDEMNELVDAVMHALTCELDVLSGKMSNITAQLSLLNLCAP